MRFHGIWCTCVYIYIYCIHNRIYIWLGLNRGTQHWLITQLSSITSQFCLFQAKSVRSDSPLTVVHLSKSHLVRLMPLESYIPKGTGMIPQASRPPHEKLRSVSSMVVRWYWAHISSFPKPSQRSQIVKRSKANHTPYIHVIIIYPLVN